MPYDLDQFIADCRPAPSRDPGPAGREEVRAKLERLLKEPAFLARHCGDDAKTGVHILYEDPKLGFQVLAHINENPRVSPPHDHGASWAIYGQATQYTDMTEWERGNGAQAPLKAARKYRLNPGHAGIYQDGMIHSIDFPAKARFIRVTGVDLDRIPRHRFDAATGEAVAMTARTTS